jgi:outer membrane protein OmpA-like peptidoglycan-associated protein
MQELHQLGLALLKIPTGKFVLIGHTDARGSDHYNEQLSRRRALAVLHILTSNYKIPAARLVATGMGERQLIAGIHPDHEANRRVEVVNLGQ